MRYMVCALALVLVPHLTAGAARADGPRPPWVPRPRPPWEMGAPLRSPPIVRLTVEVDARAKATRLVIPRSLLPTLMTAALPRGGGAGEARAGFPLWAVAVSLSLAVLCCGLRLTWPRRLCGATLPLVAAVLLAGGEEAFAKMQPMPVPNFALAGQVTVEVVEEGNAVRLILDKDHTWPIRFGP